MEKLPELPEVIIEKILNLTDLPHIKGMYRHNVCKIKIYSKVNRLFDNRYANRLLQPYAIEEITYHNYEHYDYNKGREAEKAVYYFKDIDNNTVLWSSYNEECTEFYEKWLKKFDLWKTAEIYKVDFDTFIPNNDKCPYDVKLGCRVREEVIIVRLKPCKRTTGTNNKIYLAKLRKNYGFD